ncbi:MAG TPA: cation:proton antiporter [Verrucomicrobiae bacterium]|nr:cation:proton antiporter [Verrucomicrobiae bacterium]
MGHSLINDIAICIVLAWLLAVAAQWLKQPLILAYLIAGLIAGPVGVGLISDETSVETISELGLILLLFMIGLEIDLKKMLGTGRVMLLSGTSQVMGGSLLGIVIFVLLGFPVKAGALDGLYLGIAAALSSTVIVVKILYDKREIDTLPGRLTLGILVLQDLFAIVFLAIQPNLGNPSLGPLIFSIVKVAGIMGVAFATSRYALPQLFRSVARLPELVLVGALAWCFLIAGFAAVLGLSREMGALIAGVAISTFPYTLDVTAKVTSLRDFFVTLFFVALGMKIPAPTPYLLGWSVVFAMILVATRLLTTFPPLYYMRQGHRASLLPAINLAQLSELSLVILALGQAAGHISGRTVGIAAYSFVLLAVASTYAMLESTRLAQICGRILIRLGLRDLDQNTTAFIRKTPSQAGIFLLGFSWTASSLLEEIVRKDPELLERLTILDFNPQVNQELRRRGVNVIYGDITQRDTLLHAGAGEAGVLVCTLPNTVLKGATNLRLVQQLRDINPHAQIIAHAELFIDVPKLYAAGANFVTIPRLSEANNYYDVIEAANHHLLDQKRAEQEQELLNRREVIP